MNKEPAGKKHKQTKTALMKKAIVPSIDFPLEKRRVPKNFPIKAALESAMSTIHMAVAAA